MIGGISMNANQEQMQAINSDSKKLLVMAGAGAGKTFVMVQRVTRLIKDGVNPNSILVLTFTNNAAFEMRERYKKQNPGQMIPEFRTFHSFCYSLIVKDAIVRDKMGYTSVPQVATDGQLKFIEKNAKMQTNLKVPDNKLKNPASLNKTQLKSVEIYQKAIQRLLRQENLITFDILCYDICKMFVDNDPCIQKYKDQYQYLFVDEFQDTDPKQIDFLNSFTDVSWFFCGDALQNIYGFRGCSNDTLKKLSEDPTWERIKMYQNYRSTNQICEFANKHSASYADESYRIEMRGQRDGDAVQIISGSYSSYNEPVDLDHLDQIISMVKDRAEDVAIICRTNREVNQITAELTANGIEYNCSAKNSDALHILKSVIDNEYMLNWLSTYLRTEEYADYVRQAANVENPDITWFAQTYGRIPDIKSRGNLIVNIRKILQNIRMTDYEKCQEIFNMLKIDNISIPEDAQYNSPLQLIDDLMNKLQDSASTDLYVGTIHSVKGLEFGHVIVVGAYDKNFKIDSEENRNVYYVAVTRAKNHLTVFMR